jgi:hypothetical protein
MSKLNITEPFLLAISTIRGTHLMRKLVYIRPISRISSSNDHVTVAVQADGGMNLHMADFDYISAQKNILLVLLRAERPLHPRVIENFEPYDFLVCQY